MKFVFDTRLWLIPGVLIALVVSSTGTAYAHERRDVDKYQFVVGFIVEPAYEGIKNGLDLRVTKKAPADEAMATGELTAGTGVNVNQQGAVFMSNNLSPGDTFNFEAPQELEEQTIPYYNRLNDAMKGSITISDSAELSGAVEIAIRDGAFEPADVTVQPLTEVKWTNGSADPVLVTSGLMPEAGHTNEMIEVDVPVEGLQDTLQAEVTHVATGTTKLLSLRTIFNEPGHYTADLIPTAPGVYQFHIFGTVDGIAVDETFVSRGGGGGFGDIESSDDLQFPQKLTEVREVEAAVRGAQDTAQLAQDTAIQADGKASSASTLGVIGMVLGAVGIASGVGGIAVGMRRR